MEQFDIFLNPAANRAASEKAWQKIENGMRSRGIKYNLHKSTSRENMISLVHDAVSRGSRRLIAAGGDGTLQTLLDALMPRLESEPALIEKIVIGSLGIGTSNDFHKPFTDERRFEGYPCRLNEEKKSLNDVIKVHIVHPDGSNSERYFCQSSSIGLIPVTNDLLTQQKGFFNFLYRNIYSIGMPLATLYVLCTYSGFEARVKISGETFEGIFSGMTVLKRPHMAGNFVFATKRSVSDGLVDYALCSKVSALRSLNLSVAFQEKGFAGHPEVTFRETDKISASFSRPQIVEFDGELSSATEVHWKVLPKVVSILG
ncbi:MAG: hypothetical protein HQM10_24410 [Candidatus Riflebacteria bacterium]|nr:hypothetical protein [Candidatus Riflebacteria bacterium]